MGEEPKAAASDRRSTVEALKREQKAAERRKRLPLIVGVVVVGAALIAVPTVKMMSKDSEKPASTADTASTPAVPGCGETFIDKASGNNEHVTGKVEYPTAPPSSGKHFAVPAAVNERGFYTEKDVPRLEELVHNLEHGYTVAWYLPSLPAADIDELKSLSGELRNDSKYRKFIAAPWDPSRGDFPAGKPLALSHWGATQGFRQYCGDVSADAVKKFLDAHPTSDSPEPTMA